MVNLIVAGHGEFADGLRSSLSVIAGDFEHISFLHFANDAEKLKADMLAVVDAKPNDSFLVLTDLVGGTPFKTAALLASEGKSLKVIGGANLPMLLSIVYETDSELASLADTAVQAGKEGVKVF